MVVRKRGWLIRQSINQFQVIHHWNQGNDHLMRSQFLFFRLFFLTQKLMQFVLRPISFSAHLLYFSFGGFIDSGAEFKHVVFLFLHPPPHFFFVMANCGGVCAPFRLSRRLLIVQTRCGWRTNMTSDEAFEYFNLLEIANGKFTFSVQSQKSSPSLAVVLFVTWDFNFNFFFSCKTRESKRDALMFYKTVDVIFNDPPPPTPKKS